MRILLATQSYPPVIGGLQSITHNLAKSLSDHGHEVRVVTNRNPHSLLEKETFEGISVERLLFFDPQKMNRNPRIDKSILEFLIAQRTKRSFLKILNQFKPDTVNIHFPAHQVPYILSARNQMRFRLVVSLHGDDVERWMPDEARLGAGFMDFCRLLGDADEVTTCSASLMKKARSFGVVENSKLRVIHNGVDLDRFLNGKRYEHSRPYIFAYGRFTYKKGFDLLLNAFHRIAAAFPGIDLIIAGDGDEGMALSQQVHDLGVNERVIFFGTASPEEVVELLNGCQFVVISSRQEPFGIAALEALAAGKPLIATKVDGLNEILEDEVAKLVRPDVDDLANAMRYLLDHKPEVDNTVLKSHAAKYSLATSFQKYETVILGNL